MPGHAMSEAWRSPSNSPAPPGLGSHSQQIGTELRIVVFLRPEVEWDGSKFVDQRVSQAVLGQVGGFDVGMASVATLDTHMRKLGSGVNRESVLIFLSACRTYDAAELPLAKTETAKQVTAGAVALLAEDAEGGPAITERTK